MGLSGGVDSSVAALRLKQRGYSVVGVFIKVWQPDFLKCNWEAERLDAMRVAATLNIPFYTFDAVEIYKKEVALYMIKAYEEGLTPNPDVLCNQKLKFKAFLAFARSRGAHGIATGHYAQNVKHDDMHYLTRGIDRDKDQSYFLWTLTQEQLRVVHFPIGDTKKTDIRKEAKTHSLPTAEKKDSQGICFLGDVDIQEFLGHYVDTSEGDVLDEATGTIIGKHNGALFYTTGQRHGFTVTERSARRVPHYVTYRDLDTNTIRVSTKKPKIKNKLLALHMVNWIADVPKEGAEYMVQTRYRQTPVRAQFNGIQKDRAMLKMLEALDEPARGQSCVVYKDDVCQGGGVINQVIIDS